MAWFLLLSAAHLKGSTRMHGLKQPDVSMWQAETLVISMFEAGLSISNL